MFELTSWLGNFVLKYLKQNEKLLIKVRTTTLENYVKMFYVVQANPKNSQIVKWIVEMTVVSNGWFGFTPLSQSHAGLVLAAGGDTVGWRL